MKRTGVAELKAHLSKYLRLVRRGEAVTVLDRDTPIARLVPYDTPEPLKIRMPLPGAGRLADVPLPPPLQLPPGIDILELLRQERQSDR